jgi:hypothetical protein
MSIAVLFVLLITVAGVSAWDLPGMLLLEVNKATALIFVAAAIVLVLYIMRRRRRVDSQRRP